MRGLLTEAIISCSCASESRKSCEVREAVDDEGSRGETGTEGFGLPALPSATSLATSSLSFAARKRSPHAAFKASSVAIWPVKTLDASTLTRSRGDGKTAKRLRAASFGRHRVCARGYW